jgi:spermidine synthase
MEDAGFKTAPYHAYVPSFGEWGFVMGSLSPYEMPDHYIDGLKFLNPETATLMFSFPPDMSKVQTKIQRLDDQALVRYFDQEWGDYLVY